MNIVRTPDSRFETLPDFPFEPHYAEVPTLDPEDADGTTLRVAYLDEGPRDAAPVLLMHGEPSWSFLYRHVIPGLVARDHRVIAPDLVGFGRSDKPTAPSDYTYARHVAWMEDLLVAQLDLRDATFFGQDWGGLVGLRVVAA
ncbi:MAG TPA: alpha/beta fold hydrolase, partial [Microthrixaceae bacterium]|nr:alpha/beta fold hydrolase [Microthrixaceae bacterium]